MLSPPGWVVSHAASGPASRVGSTSTTRWVSPQVETVEYVLSRRIAKSSTPSARGVPNCGSESVMTLRNVLRPAPKPSWAVSPAPGRPASASPTRSRTWMSRVVNRAYGAVNWGNGSANVRRRQSAAPQMKRRTVNRITTLCSPSGRSLQPALIAVVHPVRESTAVRTCRLGRPTSRHYIHGAEGSGPPRRPRRRSRRYEGIPERCVDLHHSTVTDHGQERHGTAKDLMERQSSPAWRRRPCLSEPALFRKSLASRSLLR